MRVIYFLSTSLWFCVAELCMFLMFAFRVIIKCRSSK